MIAGVEEHLTDEIECLLRSARDQDVVHVDANPVPARVAGDHLAERTLALCRAVLKCVGTVLAEDSSASCVKLVNGEEIRAWKATCKGDDVGLRRELEELADHRTPHGLCSLSVPVGPSCLHDVPLINPSRFAGLTRGSSLHGLSR